MRKLWNKVLAGFLVFIMTVSTGLPVLAEGMDADRADASSSEAYEPKLEDQNFYAYGIPIVIDQASDGSQGAKITWEAGSFEGTDTSWEAGSMEVPAGTVVYGGGYEGTYDETSITMNGGTIGAIYGGGVHDKADKTSIVLNGGTVKGDVFGGGEYTTVSDTNVEITAAPNKDDKEKPAVSVKGGIYMGNAADSSVSKSASVVIKNKNQKDYGTYTKGLNISVDYKKVVEENGKEVVAKSGSIGENAKAKVVFDEYNGAFLGTISEDVDEISVSSDTDESKTEIVLPADMKKSLESKVQSKAITFEEEDTQKEDSKDTETSKETAEEEKQTDSKEQTEAKKTTAKAADTEKDEKVQTYAAGDVELSDEYLYWHNLYPDNIKVNRVTAHFYKQDPTGDAGTNQGDAYNAEMTNSSEDVFFVRLPEGEEYQFVSFTYIDENGDSVDIRMTYQFRGESTGYTENKEVVDYVAGKKDCIFVGRGGQRSYMSNHVSRETEPLDNHVLYFNMKGSGYQMFTDADEPYLKLVYGDGENDFYKVTAKATMNEDCYSFVFPENSGLTTATKLRLIDARKNTVGQETVAETRFYYGLANDENMITPANLMNDQPFWGKYETKVSGDTRTIYFDNFLSALSDLKVSYNTTDNNWNWSSYYDMKKYSGNFNGSTYVWQYAIPADATQVRFTGTNNGVTWTSEDITVSNGYDYPCWYASQDKETIQEYWQRTGTLAGYWSSLYDVNTQGDNGVTIKSGTFSQEQDVYYATADFYDYYSDSELSGGSPYDNSTYNRQGDTFNRALSKYYEANEVGGTKEKTNPNTLYFGSAGTKGLNDEMSQNGGEGLYGYDPGTHQNSWDGSGNTRHTIVDGIVDDTLTDGTMTQDGLKSPLFDSSWLRGSNDYRTALGQVYSNVLFPFTMNNDGYWEFDSAKASDAIVLREDVFEGYYLERTNRPLNNPTTVASSYGFFPYDDPDTVSASDGHQRNNMNGVKMSIPFSLTDSKQVLDSNGQSEDIKFTFTGDDDVWLFIDDQLVLDLGGIHDTASATINFRTGEITYPNSGTTQTIVNLDSATVNARKELVKNLDPNKTHTITMFYMERGLEQSNLKMTFNFLQSSQLQVSNKVEIPEQINSVFDEALTHLGGFQYDLKNQAVSGGTTAVEDSAGYIKPGNHTALNATNVSGKDKIEMSKGEDQITYVNTIGQTLDVGSNNQSAIDARLGTIKTSFNIGNYEYLRMNVNSSVSSQSGASLYVALVDNDGNRIGGWASAATYQSNSNSLYANNWSMVRVDFDKLTQIAGTSFNKNNVTGIQIGFRSDATLQIKDLELYEAMQEQPTTGFQVSMEQISDYGSIQSKELSNAEGAVYEHYDSAEATNGKTSMVTGGTFALADDQRAVFTDKFRFGSYIYLNQESDKDIFDTTWTLTEGDSDILAGYLASNRGDINTVSNGNVNSLKDISGTMVNDGRTSLVNNQAVPLKGGEGETAFVYRNYANPDDTVTAPVNLKVAYTNTLKYGSVTVEKRIDVTNLTEDQINAYKNSEYEFRLLFRNVAGRALEQQVGDGTDLTATLTVRVGDTVHLDGNNQYLVGEATFDGIPAGTFYEIKEVQQDGISVSSVAAVQGTVEDGQTAHRIWEVQSPDGNNAGENSNNITDKEAHVIGIAYNSNQSYVFTNTRTETFDLKVRKDWRTEDGTNGGNDQVYVWLQRSVDGGNNWTDVPKPENHTNPAGNPGDEDQYVVQTSGEAHEAMFNNLPTLVEGKACKYRVREFTISDYTPIYSVETDGTLVVSNIPTDEVLYVQSGTFNSLADYVQKAINITGLTSDVKITDAHGNDQTNNNELFQITKDDGGNVKDIAYNAPTTGSATFNFEFTFTNEDGIQTANANVLIFAYAIQNDIYVLDYGLPAELSDQNSKDNLFANDTYEIDENTASTYKVNKQKTTSQPNGDLEITDDTDTWQTDTVSVMYTPKKFMDSVDQFDYTTTIYGEGNDNLSNDEINPTNGVVLNANIKVMPADVVYYDDSFTATQEAGSENGIIYKGKVDLTIGSDAVQSIDQDTPYGYDEAFNGENKDSLGGNAQMNAVSTGTGKDYANSGSAEFTFTGTGFEVLGRTDQSTTKIQYIVKNASTNKLVKSEIVDGYYEGNEEEGTTLYQLPVVKLTGLDRDKYKVTLQLLCKSYEKGKEGYFVFDGIRIYNPLDADATKDYSAKEQGTTVENVRDMILGNSDLADQGVLELDSIPEGAKAALMSNDGTSTELEALGATVTEVLGDDSFATNSLDDYLVSGPKGEIYLPGGSAVAFIAEADPNVTDKTMQIEAKTVNSSTEGSNSVLLNVGTTKNQSINVKSRTAMYYELDMSLCKHIAGNRYLVILTNQPGGADISLTNLKYKGYTISYPTEDQYTVPDSVVIGEEVVTAMNQELQDIYSNLEKDENIEVRSAYFANRSVKAGESVYLNVTLKDDSKSYVPVVYHYKDGKLTNITEDENLIGQSTLRAVRSYEKTVNDKTEIYRVFRIKLTPSDIMSGNEYFAVGAANGNTYCTLDNVKKVAILVNAEEASNDTVQSTTNSQKENAPQQADNKGQNTILSSANVVSSSSTQKTESVSEASKDVLSSEAPTKENSEENKAESTGQSSEEKAETSAEIKDTENEKNSVVADKEQEEIAEEESNGFFGSIFDGIQSFFSNISNKLSNLFR